MLSSASPSFSKFHPFFNKEKIGAETETKPDFISSIWDDDQILRIDENKWKWLWCTKLSQGNNAAKALDCALGKKVMYNNRCYDSKEKAHITRYQKLQHFKQFQKDIILDYSENMKAYISNLQNKSSAAIKYTIHRSSKSITSSNATNLSEMSGFISASNITTESNSRGFFKWFTCFW